MMDDELFCWLRHQDSSDRVVRYRIAHYMLLLDLCVRYYITHAICVDTTPLMQDAPPAWMSTKDIDVWCSA